MTTTAAHYDAIYRSRLGAGHDGWTDPMATVEVLTWSDELLAIAAAPPGVLLELGCGTGRVSTTLAERGHLVVGADVSALAIEAARRRPVHGHAEFHVTDVRVAFPVRQADVIVDSLLLHCVPSPVDRLAVLRLAHRTLAPGGAVLVMTMCGDPRVVPPGCSFDSATRSLRSDGVDRYHFALPDQLPGMFEEAGFDVAFSRVEHPLPGTADQDVYLAVLRAARDGHGG